MNPANDTMKNSNTAPRAGAVLALAGVLAIALAAGGCDNSSSKPQSAATPPPAPVAPQQVAQPEPEEEDARDVDTLAGLALEGNVEFPRINEPTKRDIAESVAALAGSIARGDSRALHPMLDQPNQVILDELVASGVWQESTGSITKVRVCSLEESGQSVRVGLGVESADGAYLLGWAGEKVGSSWLFSGIALDTPAEASTAAELDGGSLASRDVPEPGAIIDDTFDPTVNDPRREGDGRRRRGGRRGGGGGGPRRGF